MIVDPIPMEILKDSISIRTFIDELGKTSYNEEKVINNVRVQLDYNYRTSQWQQESLDNILFVDVKNSDPFDINDYTLDSKIKFKEKWYVIKKVEVIDNEEEVHHLEITLG